MSSAEQFPRETIGNATPTQSAPDWAVQTTDIDCPLCEYNLRGLIEPRCPECGHRFDWQVLLDTRQHLHPYLFEHHPERNVASFFRTLFGGVCPRRFWTMLKPVQSVRTRRLMLYGTLVGLIGGGAAFAGMSALSIAALFYHFGGMTRLSGFPGAGSAVWMVLVNGWKIFFGAPAAAAAVEMAWPCVTFLTLMIFQISMRQAGIKKIQVLCFYALC